jgi:hypothetical protein
MASQEPQEASALIWADSICHIRYTIQRVQHINTCHLLRSCLVMADSVTWSRPDTDIDDSVLPAIPFDTPDQTCINSAHLLMRHSTNKGTISHKLPCSHTESPSYIFLLQSSTLSIIIADPNSMKLSTPALYLPP